MFNSQFYPTPFTLVSKMIEPYREKILSWCFILEPSAGKGDIAKQIKNIGHRAKIHLIESEPELREIAKQYGSIVSYDFLDFSPDTNYDFIIMNPPFENGDAHFLKAWEISQNTTIVCLLNAETIRNPYSEKRKLITKILEDNGGTVEYIENAFSTAERKTNVETALIRVTKVNKNEFSFQSFETESEYFSEINETSLANPDIIWNLIQDFKQSKELYAEWVAKIRKSQQIAKQFAPHINGFSIADKSYSTNAAVIEFSDELRMKAWMKIIEAIGIEKYMTWKVLEWFREKMKEQGNIALNKQNIEMLVTSIMHNSKSILEDSIVSVFDNLTKYHTENRHHPEGWANNQSWMVGKKFVLPWIVQRNWTGNGFDFIYDTRGRLSDIDKALCYLTGKDYNTITKIRDSLNDAIKNSEKMEAESEFFKIKFYFKGTVHFTFKSQAVWANFNLTATKSKSWLPPNQENKWRQSNKF